MQGRSDTRNLLPALCEQRAKGARWLAFIGVDPCASVAKFSVPSVISVVNF
jgi:hypothetical protein